MIKRFYPSFFLAVLLFISCSGSGERRENPGSVSPETVRPFRLRFGGDVILAVSIDKYIRKYGTDYPFTRISGWLQGAEHTVVNLESSYTTNGNPSRIKKYVFRSRPHYLALLKAAGVDSVSLANNHLLDYGRMGMSDTIMAVKKHGLNGFGAGKNLNSALHPFRIRLFGTEVIMFSVCDVYPRSFNATAQQPGTAPINIPELVKRIRRYKKQNNIVIVLPHWGLELFPYPLKKHIRIAHRLIDAGCDAVIGTHPHVPQSIEVYKNRPIVYSLGNLLVGYWNRRYRNNIGVTLNCIGGRILYMDIHSIAGRNLSTGFQPFVVTGRSGIGDMKYLEWISRKFGTKIIKQQEGSGRIVFPPLY